MSKAGEWEIEVSQPYPCWCQLKIDGNNVLRFTHKELRDLEYVVGRAIFEARNLMPDSHKKELD